VRDAAAVAAAGSDPALIDARAQSTLLRSTKALAPADAGHANDSARSTVATGRHVGAKTDHRLVPPEPIAPGDELVPQVAVGRDRAPEFEACLATAPINLDSDGDWIGARCDIIEQVFATETGASE
jgi:hypothetical protein